MTGTLIPVVAIVDGARDFAGINDVLGGRVEGPSGCGIFLVTECGQSVDRFLSIGGSTDAETPDGLTTSSIP